MATDAPAASWTVKSDPIVQATPFFYGWVMVGISMFALYATSPGQTYGVALFNKYLATTLAAQRWEAINPGTTEAIPKAMIDEGLVSVATAYMWGTILAAVFVPWIGALADRWGNRRTMTMVVVLFGLACIFMSQVRGPFTLFLGFLCIRAMGQGSLTLLASNAADMWFQRKLGMVNGIRSLAMPIAFGTFPIVGIALIDQLGWQNAYITLGLAVWAVMLPILLLVYRNRPEDVGQLPDGDVVPTSTHVDAAPMLKMPKQFTLGEAMSERSFWIAVTLMMLWGLTGTAMMFMIVPFIESRGLVEADTQIAFTSIACSMAICQLIAGVLADRMPLRVLISLGAFLLSGAILAYELMDSRWMLATFGITFGVAQGFCAAGCTTLIARYFGKAHLGKIRGLQMTAVVAGSAAGPFLLTQGKQLMGSYDLVLTGFAAIVAIHSAVCLFATPPKDLFEETPNDGQIAPEVASTRDIP